MAKIYSYVLRYDDGAAPNPFGGVCTLTICKPVIRRNAGEGDWIIGTGSSNAYKRDGSRPNLSKHLVYAMKVELVLSLKKYDNYCHQYLPIKIPNLKSEIASLGDCIYDYSQSNSPDQRPGVHGPDSYNRDLRGENSLISRKFYYFGENAVEIPERLYPLIKQNQGHKKIEDPELVKQFEEWILEFEAGKLYGNPQILTWNDSTKGSNCEKGRCSELDDEEILLTSNFKSCND